MNKNTKNRKLKYSISFIALAVIAGISALVFMQANSPSPKTIPQEVKPMFSFIGVTDWRQGPTNETSMALFGKEREDKTSACFTSIEYHRGTVDIQSEVQKMIKNSNGLGNTIAEISTQPLSLNTMNGNQAYELHQYQATGSSSSTKPMGGVEVGYLQLDDGYVKVNGNCETYDELQTTIPALQAYKLERK